MSTQTFRRSLDEENHQVGRQQKKLKLNELDNRVIHLVMQSRYRN